MLNTSVECDLDPRLVMAVILTESGFNPSATSPKGAAGLGQLMPGTARGMGVTDPYDSKQNVVACVRLIRSGLNKYSGKAAWKDLNWNHLRLALAAYNAGSGAVKKYGGVPPYRETQNYIVKVSSYYKKLCQN
ncbi:MAG: lytic transglycosylase domain-containing protein [Armatimonadota bacterium]